jgi:hypothetical protein
MNGSSNRLPDSVHHPAPSAHSSRRDASIARTKPNAIGSTNTLGSAGPGTLCHNIFAASAALADAAALATATATPLASGDINADHSSTRNEPATPDLSCPTTTTHRLCLNRGQTLPDLRAARPGRQQIADVVDARTSTVSRPRPDAAERQHDVEMDMAQEKYE